MVSIQGYPGLITLPYFPVFPKFIDNFPDFVPPQFLHLIIPPVLLPDDRDIKKNISQDNSVPCPELYSIPLHIDLLLLSLKDGHPLCAHISDIGIRPVPEQLALA